MKRGDTLRAAFSTALPGQARNTGLQPCGRKGAWRGSLGAMLTGKTGVSALPEIADGL